MPGKMLSENELQKHKTGNYLESYRNYPAGTSIKSVLKSFQLVWKVDVWALELRNHMYMSKLF